MKRILVTLAVMTFACAMIAQFSSQGVTLFLREAGVPSSTLGLVYLAAIPFTLRFVWAPFIDRYRVEGKPRFRAWILGAQTLVCVLLTALLLTDPQTDVFVIIALVGCLMVALGTELTALGGMLAEGLSDVDYPKGASIQAAASAFAGFTLGAGVLYLLGSLGWQTVIGSLLAISLCLLVVSSTFLDFGPVAPQVSRPSLLAQFSIFRRSETRRLFLISLLISMSVLVPFATKSVLLIDAGFSVSDGGLIGLVLGGLFGVIGALAARPLIDRLGAFRVLLAIGCLNIVIAVALALLTLNDVGPVSITIAVLWANIAVFATFTANRSILLPLCKPGRQATDLASFTSVEAMTFLALAGTAISLLDSFGLSPILFVAAFASLVGLVLGWRSADLFNASVELAPAVDRAQSSG